MTTAQGRLPRLGYTTLIDMMARTPGLHLVPSEAAAQMMLLDGEGRAVAHLRDHRVAERLAASADLLAREETPVATGHGVWTVLRHRAHAAA